MKINYPSNVLAKMQEIADGCMGQDAPYCQSACPMHTDIRGYVNLIGEGKEEEALGLIREKLFLPATLGRICAHPCEDSCKRGTEYNQPMAIASLKRYVADKHDKEEKWDLNTKPSTGKKVAIIGAGPAGGQAAIDLRKEGHEVTVFEKLNVVGGMMRVGIPEYRLPRNIIDLEYTYLTKLGVNVKLGVEIGKDISMAQLEKDFDAIVLAHGAHKGVRIPFKGTEADGVYDAVEFLKEVSLTRNFKGLKKKVAVLGGGNVAIDVARSAARVGAQEVHLVCLEEMGKMPAHDWEVEEAIEEGVKVHAGYGSEQIISKDGKVSGYEIKKCTSIFDKDGNFNPQYDENSKKVLDVDTFVFAVGQAVESHFVDGLETTRGGRFVACTDTLQTSKPNVFVCGDAVVNGSVIVIEAMASARQVSTSVNRFLKGEDLKEGRNFAEERGYETKLETEIKEGTEDLPRIKTKQLDPKERIKSFVEVDLGLTPEDAKKEASRCLSCECKLCMKECVMLNEFCECPKEIFEKVIATGEIDPIIPYSCNMCNQCTLECPKDFKISSSFMDMRLEMIKANKGKSPMKGHKAIEMHQLLGFSKIFNIVRRAKK